MIKAERSDIPNVLPAGIGSYRMYVAEYDRLRRKYRELRLSGMTESASVAAYEAVCIHSQMRRIERFVAEYGDEVCLPPFDDGDQDRNDGDTEDHKLVIFVRYRYIMGFSIEETAERMNVSRSTAYRIAAQADRAIRCAR